MSRRRFAVAASVLAVLIAVLVWQILSNDRESANDLDAASSTTEEAAAGELTPDEQTPKRGAAEKTEASDPSDSSDAPAAAVGTGPYNFKTKEEAYDFFAELVGLEYDRLIAEGKPPSTALAREIVYDRVFFNNEMPQLREAMDPFLPEYTSDRKYIENKDRLSENWSEPTRLLVHTGRLPETELYAKATLPNGEIRYLKDFEILKVTYRAKGILDEKGRQSFAKWEGREKDLIKRFHSGGLSQSEEAELVRIEGILDIIRKPSLSDQYVEYRQAKPDSPRAIVTELDLGVIENVIDLDALIEGGQ